MVCRVSPVLIRECRSLRLGQMAMGSPPSISIGYEVRYQKDLGGPRCQMQGNGDMMLVMEHVEPAGRGSWTCWTFKNQGARESGAK